MGGHADSADAGARGAAREPDLALELALSGRHGGPVAGIDEAGRGPWAGPVVAAAVVLDPDAIPAGIKDSKLLKPESRLALHDAIMSSARVGVGIAAPAQIDRDNILQATLWAMREALAGLGDPPAAAIVDGDRCPDLPCPAQTLIRGESQSLSIAAASIVAKVTRDRIMIELAQAHPGYGWERNMGYGTREHADALARLGP
ncbi:MAG: ribonuclease HII, partial [Alphaproteobacteria bacterium]